MIRKSVQFILLILCLFGFVCNDPISVITVPPDTEDLTGGLTGSSTNIDRLLTVVPNLMAPNIAGEVTDLTPEVWEKLKFNREKGYLEAIKRMEVAIEIEPWRAEDEEFMAYSQQRIDDEFAKVKFLEEEQPKFYNRYIDADGVSIIGNEKTLDEYFVMARDIFLIMTSKNPRLREPLRDHFYIVIVGGFEEYWLFQGNEQHFSQLTPEHRFTSKITGYLYSNNTCASGGLGYNYGLPRTASGLGKVYGWCVSHVIRKYNDLINPTRGSPPAVYEPFWTFIHEIVHGIERIQKEMDPTFEDRLIAAHELYLASGPVHPTIIGEFWAGVTPRWLIRDHPEYINPNGRSFHTAQDFMDRFPLLTELYMQWYPDVSISGIAKYYFGRENY